MLRPAYPRGQVDEATRFRNFDTQSLPHCHDAAIDWNDLIRLERYPFSTEPRAIPSERMMFQFDSHRPRAEP